MKNFFKKYGKTILLSYGLICLSYPFIPKKVCLVGANGLNNSSFLSNWYAYRMKKSYLENPPLLNTKAEWCLAYGMSGLDGGEGGVICGYLNNNKKFIYVNPHYDCSSRNKNGDCNKIRDSLVRKYTVNDFLVSEYDIKKRRIKDIVDGNYSSKDNINNKKAIDFKYPLATTYVRRAYSGFNPFSDWFWFKLHYGESSFYSNIISFFIFIFFPGTTILYPFIAPYFLYLLIKEFTNKKK